MSYTHLDAPKDGFVFVVTYGRSGSTVVQNVLNSIPGYCIRGENANALGPLAYSWHMLRSAPILADLHASGEITRASDPWYGFEKVNPHHFGKSLANVFTREVLRLPPGTRVGGFKEIRFHSRPPPFPAFMDFLRRIFPRTRLVFNVRNHEAVLQSGWWREADPVAARAELEGAERQFLAQVAEHPETSLLLRYEDYNGNPEGFRPLFDFLGEPFDRDRVAEVLAQRLVHMQGPQG